MVAAAGRRAEALGLDNVSARTLDLERIAEPDAAYDVVLCREGLMFAGDAVRAATDIRRVLRRGGRVAVSVWADRGANPWLGIVGHAFSAELGRPASQAGPNPFALGDPDRLGAVLSEAGFRDVAVEPLSVPRRAASVDAWWQWVTALAPIAQALAALPEATAERIRARACEAAAVYTTEDGLEIPGLALIASGRSFG
jgi:SAM-dependent methyltransferase